MIPSNRRSRSGHVVGSLLLLLVIVLPLRADARDVEEAKLRFEKAEMAYKLGQYTEAIREYEAAYRAMPDPAFLFNIAQSHRLQYRIDRKSLHLSKALSLYKSYLREMPRAPNREVVRKLIEELESLVTSMQDRTEPEADQKEAKLVLRGDTAEGGQAVLDGKSVGAVPLSRVVEPGLYLVEVVKPGFKKWSTSVTVTAGSTIDLPVVLEPLPVAVEGTSATPFYKRWWFWTIVGVAVAGGATGAYFATRGDEIPAMPEIDLR